MDDRLEALEARVARLEQALIAQRMLPTPVVVRHESAAAAFVGSPSESPAPSARVSSARTAADAERFVGGRVLLAVGAFALLLGVAFFLKYAFDNGWIGPSGRVAVGLLAGAALILGSQRMRARSQPVFAQGLVALGAGILYLSLWAAGNGFHLVPLPATFVAMCAVTAFLIALASRQESELTATWGLIGGFLTPTLNAGNTTSFLVLFAYLALLDAALLFVPRAKPWNRLAPFALLITQSYFLITIAGGTTDVVELGFATIYLVLFTARPAAGAIARRDFGTPEIVVVVLAGITYYGALHLELYGAHRVVLATAIVVLAAIYLLLARRSVDTARGLFAAFALALVTAGVAVAFSGATVGALWAIEGALLAWAGTRTRLRVVEVFSVVAFLIAVLDVAVFPPAGGSLFFNDRFITFSIIGASFAVARFAPWTSGGKANVFRSSLPRAAEVIAHLFVISAFSYEFWHAGHGNQLVLTLFWLLYGAALLGFGFARNSMFVRIEGLGLLAISVVKAFVVDMSEVDPAIRIVSFLVLGTVLLVASYFYLRSRQLSSTAKE